ncbi:MAG: hypothetical protein AAFN74_22540 [Myxococcota bacterium]
MKHYAPVFTGILLFLPIFACGSGESAETWEGDEKWAKELIPDDGSPAVPLKVLLAEREAETPSVSQHKATWTQWFDRDNPSGTGDWELRSLQAGVCPSPTGVECRTTSNLALWQTGEVVSCSVNGLVCRNSDQPDGDCDYDYKVRYLCPDCELPTCGPGQCGTISNSCGSVNCGPCPECTNGSIRYEPTGSCCCDRTDFDNPVSREEEALYRCVGGQWRFDSFRCDGRFCDQPLLCPL